MNKNILFDLPRAANQMHLINLSSASVSTSKSAEVLAVCWSGAFRCVNTMLRSKKIDDDLRDAIAAAAHQYVRGHTTLPYNFESISSR